MSATRVTPLYKDPIHKMLLCSGNTQNEIARSVVLNLVTSASDTIDSFHECQKFN
jgi:hypothetical protein